MKLHIKDRKPATQTSVEPQSTDQAKLERQDREDDARSLDLVQRVVGCVLVIVLGGGIAAVLSAFSAVGPAGMDRAAVVGMWVMGGAAGLLTAGGVLMLNRRHPYSPPLLLGLIPMLIAAFWVWG